MRGRKLVATALGATLALAMVACGADDDPVSAGAGAQTGVTTPPATAAPAPTAPVTTAAAVKATVGTASTSLGTVFVDASGRTLYTWDRDTGPTSTCTGTCAATWPPLTVAAGAATPVGGPDVGTLTTSPRPDDAARLQVVWGGKPLYLYAGDAGPGETKGDGVGGTWHVAKAGY